MSALSIEFLGVTTPRGAAIHLYDVEGDRLSTLCGRHIGYNTFHLAVGGIGPQVSSDLVSCGSCVRLATPL
jgi:hypothetical protein